MNFTSFISASERLLFANRRTVVSIFIVLTIFLGWSATNLRMEAGFSKLLPLKHEYLQAFTEYQEEFGGANQVLVALMAKDGNIYDSQFMESLRLATDDIFFIQGVDRSRVYSLWTPNVRYREVVEDGIAGGNVIPGDYTGTPEGLQKIRRNVFNSEWLGRLVANDLSGAIVKAEFTEINPATGEKLDYLRVAKDLEAIRAKYENDQISVHIIGFAKMVGDMADGAKRVVLFFALAFLITAIMVYVYTSSFRRTCMLLLCALIAVVWQLGLLPLLGFGIDPMGILVPFLVFAIAVSHGVQMVSANGSAIFDGVGPLEAAKLSFRKLAIPSVTALMTDLMGFLTILLISISIIQEMAITASLGVAVIIVTNLLLLPILLSFIKADLNYRNKLQRRSRLVAPMWRKLSKVASRKTASVIIVMALLLMVFGLMKSGDILIGDTQRGVPELRQDSRYNLDTEIITSKFSIGVDQVTVYAEGGSQGCVNHEILSAIDQFAWHMRNIEGIHSSITLPSVIKVVTSAWNEGSPKWQVLPRNQQLTVQALGSIPTCTGLLNGDGSVMPLYFFTTDHKAETLDRIMGAAETYLSEHPSDKVKFRLAGGNVGVTAATNEVVLDSQTPILIYVYLAVIIFCLVAFRSLRATICILLPLGLVSLLGYSLMAILGIGLKVNTLPIVALGVGVGVDYGIYIYGTLKSFLDEGIPLQRAYELTLDRTGNGVLLTGLSLAVGCVTWIFSPLQFQADMGILLTFMFLVNMLGAVFLLPALASWLLPVQSNQE